MDGSDVDSAEGSLRAGFQSVCLENGLIEGRAIPASFHLSLRTSAPPI